MSKNKTQTKWETNEFTLKFKIITTSGASAYQDFKQYQTITEPLDCTYFWKTLCSWQKIINAWKWLISKHLRTNLSNTEDSNYNHRIAL